MRIIKASIRVLVLSMFGMACVCLFHFEASAQICAGSNLRYVVRDGKGKIIDPTGVYEPVRSSEISELKEATKVFKGTTQDSIRVVEVNGMCNFREPVKVALKLKGKVMNLTFLMPKFTQYESRSFLVDSIPFRPGTFEIDLTGAGEVNPAGNWLGRLFPATGWKKVKSATP